MAFECNLQTKTYCSWLSRYLNRNQAIGFTVAKTKNPTTGEDIILGVRYNDKPGETGTLINVCPWCGKSLYQQITESVKSRKLWGPVKKKNAADKTAK